MIVGIGIDAVEIERFNEWSKKDSKELERIFSVQEINYCLESTAKSAERFAARFAAREAFFKALRTMKPHEQIPFFTVCKAIAFDKNADGLIKADVDWHLLTKQDKQDVICHVSWTHTKMVASAVVILEKQ